jgi:hypothetical protein
MGLADKVLSVAAKKSVIRVIQRKRQVPAEILVSQDFSPETRHKSLNPQSLSVKFELDGLPVLQVAESCNPHLQPLGDEPDRERVLIEFTVARLHRGDDDEDQVGCQNHWKKDNANEDEDAKAGHDRVNRHGNLEVQSFLSMRIDGWNILLLDQPKDQGSENVAKRNADESRQRCQMAKNVPRAICFFNWLSSIHSNLSLRMISALPHF